MNYLEYYQECLDRINKSIESFKRLFENYIDKIKKAIKLFIQDIIRAEGKLHEHSKYIKSIKERRFKVSNAYKEPILDKRFSINLIRNNC